MLLIPPATTLVDEFMIEVHATWQNHLPNGAREDEFLQALLVEKPRTDLKVLRRVLARDGWKGAGI